MSHHTLCRGATEVSGLLTMGSSISHPKQHYFKSVPSLNPTDSTIAPPQKKTAVFFNGRFTEAARHEGGCYETKKLHITTFRLVAKACRTMTSGRVAKGPRIVGDPTRSWCQNRRFRSKKVGGGYCRRTTQLDQHLFLRARKKQHDFEGVPSLNPTNISTS